MIQLRVISPLLIVPLDALAEFSVPDFDSHLLDMGDSVPVANSVKLGKTRSSHNEPRTMRERERERKKTKTDGTILFFFSTPIPSGTTRLAD